MTIRAAARCPAALVMVMAAGIALGFFAWNTFFGAIAHLYPLEFTGGHWITTAEEAPQAYFRKEVYIAGSIQAATVMTAATDSFTLYVNGQTVGARDQAFSNVGGLYDLRQYLRPGKNVIAAEVRRVTYPGPAQVAVEGTYVDQAGSAHLLISDTSWKASSHDDWQGNGRIRWHAPAFVADAWASARVKGLPSSADVVFVETHPEVFRLSPQGQWIGPADPKRRSAIFHHTFHLTQEVQGAWVRLAAVERYALSINGVTIASSEVSSSTLDIYEIRRFLRRGANTLEVNVAALQGAPIRFMLDGIVALSGRTEPIFATNALWRTKEFTTASWRPVTVLTDHAPGIDRLSKNVLQPRPPLAYAVKHIVYLLSCVVFVLFLTLLLWIYAARLSSRFDSHLPYPNALTIDALLHLPCPIVLLILFLLQYDIRVNPASLFQQHFLYFILGSILGLRLFLWSNCESYLTCIRRSRFSLKKISLEFVKRQHTLLAIYLIVLCLAGAFLRIDNVSGKSLSHDEAGLPIRAQAILERGYPFNTIGPIEKPVTTYELLPYPIALSIALLGTTDFAVRLPAVVFGTLTILLIYYVDSYLWGRWTGILASTIYAFFPFAITWGSNAFHPQQTQFFTLLTSFLFYQAISQKPPSISIKYLYISAISFIFTYLSWEPSAFLLIALFIGLISIKRRDLSWLKCWHLWIAFLFTATTIFVQLSSRILFNVPYVVVGKGLSDTTITLFFLDPLYNPWFYLDKLLLSGIHLLLTLSLIIGSPLIFKDQGTTYFFSIVLTILICLTNFLPNQSVRYSYFIQPFLVMTSASIIIRLAKIVWNLSNSINSGAVWVAKIVFCVGFPLIVFFQQTH